MSKILVAVVGLIYTYVAYDQYMKGSTPMMITYMGYALGNIGLYQLAT